MRFRTMTVALSIAGLIAAPGCAHKVVQKVAIVDARDHAAGCTVEPAPSSGMYKVQLIDMEGHYLKSPLYAADRWVKKGDPLGFERADDGRLIAVAGPQTVELSAPLPADAAHLMWYHKSKQPTQFARSAGRFGKATADTIVWTAAGIGVAAGAAAIIWFAVHDACDDDTPCLRHVHRR